MSRRRSQPRRRSLLFLAAVLLPAAAWSGGGELPPPLRPFEAAYRVVKGPLRLGTTSVTLQAHAGGWRYRSVTEAEGIFALFVDGKARELATLVLHEGTLRPLRYVHDEPDDADDVRMDFDWDAATVRIERRDGNDTRALEPGTHDQFTVALSMIEAVAGGAESSSIPGVDDDGERLEFRFEVTGREAVEVPLGRYEAVRVRRVRDDDRATVTWLAPALDWLPVAVEQRHEGDLVARMELETLDGRSGDDQEPAPSGR